MLSTLIYGALAFSAVSVNARALPEQSLYRRHGFGTTGQCAPQVLGSGPVTNNPDTADAFVANPAYANIANSAVTPAGWSVAYQNLQAASTTGGYLGVQELTSYNTSYCAAQCCGFWPGCTSFNIYLERDPIVDPGDNCTDPASTTRIKCSFWSQNLTPSDATNNGQYCSNFHVVIAGSNGYNAGSACATATTTSTSSAPTATTPAAGTKITACPWPETTYTATDGSTWAICKGADYQGTTTQNINNIYDDPSCAAACDATSGCTKAVFYSQGSVCYVKGGSLSWVVNPIYDTIRQLTGPTNPTPTKTPASGTKISACPWAETTYTAADGSTWAICKGTDYQGTTTQNINWIYDNQSCAAACDATNGCTKAVFYSKGSVCYVKGSSLSWVVNPIYDTVRQLTGPTPTPTPAGWNTWTQPTPKKICILGFCF